MADYDNSYKLLFSHREMVEDLLRGFVRESWVDQLDFATLEKASGSYVSDDLRDREDDVIWRVRFGDDWIYVYILLEFQFQNFSCQIRHFQVLAAMMRHLFLPVQLQSHYETEGGRGH